MKRHDHLLLPILKAGNADKAKPARRTSLRGQLLTIATDSIIFSTTVGQITCHTAVSHASSTSAGARRFTLTCVGCVV